MAHISNHLKTSKVKQGGQSPKGCGDGAAKAKPKMRTSEDVFRRMQWDPDWHGAHVTIGYEDRIHGPMETALSAFVPLSEGGVIPFHRLWYFRRGDEVLWDRLRRLDLVFHSGDTPAILAGVGRGFDAGADALKNEETLATIARAVETMKELEQERLERVDIKQREKLRKAKRTTRSGDHLEEVQVQVVGGTLPSPWSSSLRMATWNVLVDTYNDDPELCSLKRAPVVLGVLLAAQVDVVALQEVTADMLDVVCGGWPQPFWCVRGSDNLAILSRHPIVRASTLRFGPVKSALVVEVSVNGRSTMLANVHLTSDRRGDQLVDNSETRAKQARHLRSVLTQLVERRELIICGDFNEPSAFGVEAAAACMEGLTDVWLATHGDEDEGYTYDPTVSRLADLQSLSKTPRRLDRIFASQRWRPEAASLLGVGLEASDHHGIVADLFLDSPLCAAPCTRNDVCVWVLVRLRFEPPP